MARKHNTKHNRSASNYPQRLADRGLSRTPVMKWTGLSTTQIQNAFMKLPTYKWDQRKNEETGEVFYVRREIR